VKHKKGFKMLQLLYHSLMTKLSTPPCFKKFFKHSKKHITLLAYLLPCPAACVAVMSSRSWGTVGHLARLQQSAVDSAIDGEHVFATAFGSKEDSLSSDNMLDEW